MTWPYIWRAAAHSGASDPSAGQQLEQELAQARRMVATLLRRRFDSDPHRHAADGMEAVQQLLSSGEPDQALDLMDYVSKRLASVPSVVDLVAEHQTPVKPATTRQPAIYRGIRHYHQGDLPSARAALSDAQNRIDVQRQPKRAAVIAYYFGRTLLGLGDLFAAFSMAQRTRELVQKIGAQTLLAHADLLHAQIAFAACQPAVARRSAERVLDAATLPQRIADAAQMVIAKAHAIDQDWSAMQKALALPLQTSAAQESTTASRELAIECAELCLLASAAPPLFDAMNESLRSRIDQARRHFATRGQRYQEARAALALAGMLLICGSGDDVKRADALLGRAQELGTRYAYGLLHLRCLLFEAAVQKQAGNARRVESLLTEGIDLASSAEDSLELRLLQAALPGRAPSSDDPQSAEEAILRRIGLRSAHPYEILDRHGSREADEKERQRLLSAALHDLIIEPDRGSIAGRGGVNVSGRPLMAQLLCALLPSDEAGVSAERLFYEVWGGREYHPLRHRNTIYVAIGRLRQALRVLLPGREIIETLSSGWRLARDVDVCAIRAKPVPRRAYYDSVTLSSKND